MTDRERRWLEELSLCTFPPGSRDRRLVRSLSVKPDAVQLTDSQREFSSPLR